MIDALQFISKFKFVFGFCNNVDENALRIILDQNKLNAADGKLPKVFTFNYGNCKGSGDIVYEEPQFHFRSGSERVDMKNDTLGQVKKLLNQDNAPKCIFVVHGHASQVKEIRDEIHNKPLEYKYGKRSVFMLEDTDSINAASTFINQHRANIGNPEGWVFISHRGVARGVDINGVEAATMVINFRFANASELEQTLGRGNRSPLLNLPVQSHIFVDSDVTGTLLDMKTADLNRLN